MEQNSPRDRKLIKIVAKREGETVPTSVIPGESFSTIPCYIVPMVNSLEKPIPIPKSRKKKRK